MIQGGIKMRQERLKVLAMLEDGKITADDAAALLGKLNEADGNHFISDDTAEHVEESLQRFAKNAEHFAKEFGQKAYSAYKDVEPKLKKASQAALEKTASIVDEIAQALHESIEKAQAEEAAYCKENNCDEDTPKPN